MTDFQKLIDEAVEVRTDEGAVDDTLAELRTHFASTMDILLDRQFDLVCQQYMRLTHDKGLTFWIEHKVMGSEEVQRSMLKKMKKLPRERLFWLMVQANMGLVVLIVTLFYVIIW